MWNFLHLVLGNSWYLICRKYNDLTRILIVTVSDQYYKKAPFLEVLSYMFGSRQLLLSDFRLEPKGFQFEHGCQLYAEVSSLKQSPG